MQQMPRIVASVCQIELRFWIKDRVARVPPHSREQNLFEEGDDGVSLVVCGGWGSPLWVWGTQLLPCSSLPHLPPVAYFVPKRRSGAGGVLHSVTQTDGSFG